MSERKPQPDEVNDRVARYRARTGRRGYQRVETTVPREDALLIKDVARILRQSDELADELRRLIRTLVPGGTARTGEELLEFFQTCPLGDNESIDLPERDRSTGRAADFGE